MLGFELDGPRCYRKVWKDDMGVHHIITVAYVVGGWMYRWERGPTMTIREGYGGRSLDDIMGKLWEDIFQMQMHYHELIVLQAKRIVRGEAD